MIGVVLLAAAAACLPPAPGWPLEQFQPEGCPQVYRIHGTAPLDRALNVLVLPAGFTETELDGFRCGTGLMIEQLLTFAPLSSYSDSINVYRIDLASSTSGVGGEKCNGSPCEPEKLNWLGQAAECAAYDRDHPQVPTRAPGRFSTPCMALDLDVQACPSSAPYCKVLWPSGRGQRLLWRLAACAPASHLVLVLANTELYAGGGIEDAAHGLAVTTFRGIDEVATRSEILAHELGHALGLLDEYFDATTYKEGVAPPGFLPGRNVVQAAPDGTIGQVPWAGLCMDSTGKPGPCQVKCRCDSCKGTPDASPAVGLYEGGFYSQCGYYVATQYCRMEDLSDDSYCPACALYLKTLFEQDLNMRPGEPER